MKKFIFCFFFFLFFASFLNANELYVENGKEKAVKKVSFMNNSDYDFSAKNSLQKKISYYSYRASSRPGAKALNAIGTGIFGFFYGFYIFLALSLSIGLGVVYDATSRDWLYLGGVMGTSFIPILGPFFAIPFVYALNENSNILPERFFGGCMALCSIFGTMQISGFVLMIIGFAMERSGRGRRAQRCTFFVQNDMNGNVDSGVAIKF